MELNIDESIDFFKEMQKRTKEIEDYSFVLIINDGMIQLELAKITNEQFFYFLDNGSPIYNIYPKFINIRLSNYIDNEIENRLSEDIISYINGERNDIDNIFKKYGIMLDNELKSLILGLPDKLTIKKDVVENDETIEKIETYKARDFYKNVSIKVKKGEIYI